MKTNWTNLKSEGHIKISFLINFKEAQEIYDSLSTEEKVMVSIKLKNNYVIDNLFLLNFFVDKLRVVNNEQLKFEDEVV